MTAPREKPSSARMQRLLGRLRARYDGYPTEPVGGWRVPLHPDHERARQWFRDRWPGRVDASYLRPWLSNSNRADEHFQYMAEYNAREGRWSVARFCRLMCFTSKTQRGRIR